MSNKEAASSNRGGRERERLSLLHLSVGYFVVCSFPSSLRSQQATAATMALWASVLRKCWSHEPRIVQNCVGARVASNSSNQDLCTSGFCWVLWRIRAGLAPIGKTVSLFFWVQVVQNQLAKAAANIQTISHLKVASTWAGVVIGDFCAKERKCCVAILHAITSCQRKTVEDSFSQLGSEWTVPRSEFCLLAMFRPSKK